ncbi:hypothetical protein [Ralstonia phage RP13]|nr:hypothetical protein [Ralstonia phage RP13]
MSNVPQNIQELGLTSYDSFLEYGDIKTVLLNRLKALPNWAEIDKTFSGSGTLELILHLVCASHEIQSFMNLRGVQESFLEFAQLNDSIYAKARELGYRINRPNAPVVIIEYTGVPTVTLHSGDTVGTYNGYDLIYFGPNLIIEQTDQFSAYVGKFNQQNYSFDPTTSAQVIDIITPQTLQYVDNTNIRLLFDSTEQIKTIFPEDYIVFQKYADFSESLSQAKLFVADFTLMHGLAETMSSSLTRSYTVQYIETDGKSASININDLTLDTGYRAVNVDSLGTTGDAASDIVKNAPLVYSLLRRAITETDFTFLLSSLPQIKSAAVVPYGGVAGVWEITPNVSPTVNNFISINSLNYAYQNITSLPQDSVTTILYKQLRQDNNITPELIPASGGNPTKIRIYSKSSRIPVNISVSSGYTINIITTQVLTRPCILHVRYVGHNTVDTAVPLTFSEYTQVENVVDYYKPVGLTLYYEHAVRVPINLTFVLSLTSSSDVDLVTQLATQVIESYNLRTDLLIDSADILNTVEKYINQRFNSKVIQYTIDSVPVSQYVDKTSYSKLTYNLSFA